MIKAVNGALWDGNRILTNFLPIIAGLFVENNDPARIWFRLELAQGESRTTVDPLPYSALHSLRFDTISPAFQCMDASNVPTDQLVRQFLRAEIAHRLQTDATGILFSRMGWNTVPDGRHVFIAGDRVIGDISGIDYVLAPSLRAVSLPDMEICTRDLFRRLLDMVSEEPDVIIPLLSYCIRSMLIAPFVESGYPLRFVLYLMGKQGLGKTTTAKKFALPFDRSSPVMSPLGMIDAGSTPSALKTIFDELCDVPVLLDDVAVSTDTREQQKRKATVAQLVRFVANDAGFLRMRGNQPQHLQSGCGMIVTAELPLETASDITRCATVMLFEQMHSLTEDDRALTAAVISRFLVFFAVNYDGLVDEIRQTLRKADGVGECLRQQQIYDELSLCFRLLLLCGQRLKILNGSEFKSWHKRANEAFSLAFTHNRDLLDNLEKKNLSNIAKIILTAIDTGDLKIAKTPEKFVGKSKYDGFRTTELVCIRPDALLKHVNRIADKNLTKNELGKRLRNCGLVEQTAEGRTAAWKRDGFPRMIAFNWKMLKKQAKDG